MHRQVVGQLQSAGAKLLGFSQQSFGRHRRGGRITRHPDGPGVGVAADAEAMDDIGFVVMMGGWLVYSGLTSY